MISLLVAAAENNAIGKDGQLLWHLPNDLRYFKNLTWGKVVVMGRKTYEAVNKPLPGRVNIVITSQEGWQAAETRSVTSINKALDMAAETNSKEIFVIGGGEIYKQTIDNSDRIYMTRVHADFDGDAYFPEIDETKWAKISSQDFEPDEKHKYGYSFEVWEKK